MPDQPSVAQLSEGAEMLGHRLHVLLATEVDHIEVISAELAEVLLDLAAKVIGPSRGPQLAGPIPARPNLGDDDQVVRVRRQRRIDQLIGRAERGEIERTPSG